MAEKTVDTQDIKLILQKLDEIDKNSQKTWMAALTEDSTVLMNTDDIALLTRHSYHHTYKEVVSHPDFPKPIQIAHQQSTNKQKRKRPPSRRWISGEVIKYLRQKSLI